MDGPTIDVVAYDPAWPERFDRESERVRRVLGDKVMAIEHFGSTAVPGLAAKPIIDFCVVLEDQAMASEAVDQLEELGYQVSKDWDKRTVLRRTAADGQSFNLHLGWPETLPGVRGNLAFREYLRDTPSMRERYATVKREAAEEVPDDVEGYYEAKNPIIEELMERATEAGYRERVDDLLP